MKKLSMVLALLLLPPAACTKSVDLCKGDADCTDIAFPFCDVNGEFPPSGGQPGVCTIVPPDCPVDRCGCDPGATTCGSGELTTCNPDGKSQTMVACGVGCEDDGTGCKTFDPSNGLGPALMSAAMQQDVVFPSQVTIDTTTGSITDSSGVSVTVTSLVVAQGSSSIRVFVAKSFEIHDATIAGTMAVAFVADGAIEIDGDVDASANLGSAGPGALDLPALSVGGDRFTGGGGGGNSVGGGSGSPTATSIGFLFAPGGMPQTTFEPLTGGGRGGTGSGDGVTGGGGGGGVQMVSATKIDINAGAMIDIGGGGGGIDGGGGGAGGNAVLQAPIINLDGSLTANGASGGSCGIPGNDATTTAAVTASVGCNGQAFEEDSGSGGNVTTGPGDGVVERGTGTGTGGGGSVGRAQIDTLDGTFEQGTSAVVSAVTTTQMLITH
jgi:hypothetical protein